MMNTPMPPAAAIAAGVPCMDVAALAALLGCAPHYVRHHVSKRPGFPQPMVCISRKVCFWRTSDVLAWLNRSRVRGLRLADIDAPRLTVAGIADLLGCTPQHVADVLTKRADFPLPCIALSSRLRSWLYRDVLAWLGSSTQASVPPFMDAAAVAARLGCTRQHVTDCLARQADFPQPFLQASRRLRFWRTSDVQAWIAGRRRYE